MKNREGGGGGGGGGGEWGVGSRKSTTISEVNVLELT